jgi:hypothetical protein
MNIKNLPRYWKAVAGFFAPAASIIGLAVLPGSDGGSSITQAEWITAAVAAIVTASTVGVTRNQPIAPPPPPPSDDEA